MGDNLHNGSGVARGHVYLVLLRERVVCVEQRGANLVVACGFSNTERLCRVVEYRVACLMCAALRLLVDGADTAAD